MCTRYIPPDVAEIEREWHIGRHNQGGWVPELFPLSAGPFLRRVGADADLELVLGQWGMIPRDSETRIPMKSPKPGEKAKRISTVNARTESVASRPTFRDAWKHGQRCIIPAASFDEPNWETQKNVWWRFWRADGAPWGLAGLWSIWTDPLTGELVPNYTMLTLNANAHPLMSRMHKNEIDKETGEPLPMHLQDKRSLIAIERGDVDRWLAGTVEEAKALMVLPAVEVFNAMPMAKEGA